MIEIIGSYEGEFEPYWRVIFSFPIPALIIELIMLIFVFDFETPKYLLQEDREEECIELL